MPPHRYERLVEVVRRRAGERLRAAFYYDADGWEPLYRRPNLPKSALKLDAQSLYERIREREPLATEEEISGVRGRAEAYLELHDNLVLLHLAETESQGALISFDRAAARNLSEFVDECADVITPSEEMRFFAADRGEEELG